MSRHLSKSAPGSPHRSESITTVVVDSSRQSANATCDVLGADTRLDVIGTAINGHDAIEIVRKLKPQLVVMELALPEVNGLEATCRIKELLPEVRVVVVTDAGVVFRNASFAVGASSFVPKRQSRLALPREIRRLFPGHHPHSGRTG